MRMAEISDNDFRRLQQIAEPLVDTLATVVTKVIDHYESTYTAPPKVGLQEGGQSPRQFAAERLPPLRHTVLMAAEFDEEAPQRTNWASLVRLALTKTYEMCGSAKELHRLSGANVVQGFKDTDGYKYMASHDFSYQGVSADDAARCIVRCAKSIGCSLTFEFEWQHKGGAHLPGQRGKVALTP